VTRTLAVLAVVLAWLPGCSRDRAAPVRSLAPSQAASPEPVVSEPVQATASASGRPAESDLADPNCQEQQAQEFLQRAHINRAPKDRAERHAMLELRARAIEYRTQQYGYFEGFGRRSSNPISPARQSKATSFFGLSVVLHERVIPALACVERQLQRDCADSGYRPSNLSGLRKKNTYVDGEISNHVYGIAIDIDPLKNPCCKCLEPWSSSERCRGRKTVWERMAMPECWVKTFERFGFYWLGHDLLEDTMHFEFLGDPARILRHAEPLPSR
jgi:hypothetical protein